MKKFNKIISVAIVVAIMMATFACTAFAANPSVEELQKSVVYITGQSQLTSANFRGLTSTNSWSGTGFAVGKTGEPVQYIVTCEHCVNDRSGIYAVGVDSNNQVVNFVEQKEGTAYPQNFKQNGITYYVDYFNGELVELNAVFSEATNDSVKLSVVDTDEISDVAVCKLASDPTDKLVARALLTSEGVKVGDTVYAIGYPASSEKFNTMGTHDQSDTTVTKGIVSKTLMTAGTAGESKLFLAHQFDAQITHGNSGGPLFTEKGYIIGVNAFGNADEKSTKANYAIAVDELIKLLDASSVPYELANDINIGLIIGIIAAVVVAAIVIVFFVLKNKKKGLEPVVNNVPAPAMDATAAVGNQAALVSGKYYLLGIKGVYEGKKYSIDERVVIGRNKEKCNVVYPDNQPGISGIHCEIIRSGSVLTLKDCGSTYGTFLGNGTKVTPNLPVVLKSGERFWVGDKENIFEVKY